MQIKIMNSKKAIKAAILLVTTDFIVNVSGIKFNASKSFEDIWSTENNLENELEQKRSRSGGGVNGGEEGGSGFGGDAAVWSTCSRSCDGGVAQQLRRCHSLNGCKGESIRYKICNMQPCPDSQDFRAHQCAAYDYVPYDGKLFKWTPHYDYVEPCALTCRGRPAQLPDDESTVETEDEKSEHHDESSVIVQLSSRVKDGTRCRAGSLDMCIQGKCQRVGCDLKIGSTKKVDACGVCGGNDSSCSRSLYHWQMTPMSRCSVKCDGGNEIYSEDASKSDDGNGSNSNNYDKDDDDDDSVDDDDNVDSDHDDDKNLYNDQPYYSHQSAQPTHHDELPPKVEPLVSEKQHQRTSSDPIFIKDSEWSPCSVTCGEGIRLKMYKCKIFLEYSQTIATLNDSLCEGPKPQDEVEYCMFEPCALAFGGVGGGGGGNVGAVSSGSIGGDDDIYPRDSIKVGVSEPGKTYIWNEQGYTSCSASCLGGVEELIINCVRGDSGKIVSPFLCSPETKPEARVRTCNDRPCPPRWNYSDYTPCSKSCGIGIKTREVTCIHEVTRGDENTMVVPNNMCPQPPPADRQYCNVLDCPVRWEVSEWSKCSQSCGYGIKLRRVECKQIMAQEHKIERPESMCPSAKPANKKPCNVKPCPPADPRPTIVVNNSTYIQHDPKKTKITLKIGGAAEIFFGTQVKIKCPVKRYNRTKIRWSKDHRTLTKSKKFKISKKGALRITDITFRDAGIYICHAGLSAAEINIKVKAKLGEIQPNEFDKHREETDRSTRDRNEAEFLTSADIVSGEKGSTNNKKKQRESDGNQQKSDGTQHADSSVMDDELLWPFQSFSSSKGHHMLLEKGLDFGIDLEQLEKDEPAKIKNINEILSTTATVTSTKTRTTGTTTTTTTTVTEDSNILGKDTKDDIKFEWEITSWSECSQTCGTEDGLRKRDVFCVVKIGNLTQRVDNGLCEDASLIIPDTFESCGQNECPKWVTGVWSICQQSRCFSRNTAIQKREILCKFSNDTISDRCDENEKPIERQECYNELCKGVWRVEPWSECNAACGSQGIKYRILQCVWYGTRRPAGNACRNQPRPAVMKVCKGPPCMSNLVECKDTSRYCRNVRSMGLCRLHRYQQKCCKSCKFNIYN